MKSRLRPLLVLIPILLLTVLLHSPTSVKSKDVTIVEATPSPTPVEEATPTPEPTPTPTPTPEPTPTPPIDIDADGNFTVYGRTINVNDTYIDFSHMEITDNGDAIASMLRYMPNLEALDMDSCGVSNEAMAAIQEANPDIEVIWRIWFGENYSVRTNVTKILASKPSKGGDLTDEVGDVLKYCTKVRYLDLGHNESLSDFSFVQYMPDLEICVASITALSDLTPFASCSNLLYLEAGNTNISDLSPLANCTKLAHLNVGTCYDVSDITPLYDLPMYRLWLGSCDPVPAEQVAKMQELHPDCTIDTECPSGEGGENEGFVMNGWKYYQKYLTADWNFNQQYGYFPDQRPLGYFKVAYKAFQYNLLDSAYSFSWNDPNLDATSHVDPVNTYVIDTSQLSEYWDKVKDDDERIDADNLDDPPGETVYVDPY